MKFYKISYMAKKKQPTTTQQDDVTPAVDVVEPSDGNEGFDHSYKIGDLGSIDTGTNEAYEPEDVEQYEEVEAGSQVEKKLKKTKPEEEDVTPEDANTSDEDDFAKYSSSSFDLEEENDKYFD